MRAILVMVALLVLAPSIANARCLQYEPTVVFLRGEFVSKMLPGAPNYTSVARGDLPERVLFLVLDEPICVTGNVDSTFNSRSRAGITKIQLHVPLGQSLKLLGQRIRVFGTLFGANMQNHRTKVLMDVEGLSVAAVSE